mgnify:FL=1
MNIPDNIKEITDTLHGVKAYIYGGAVRDILSGHIPMRCKIAVNAPLSELQNLFSKSSFLRGALRATICNTDCRIISLHDNINNLCAHSDFTVNSLAYSPETGIIDDFGGADDVKNKIIRFTQDCEDNLRENPVIMLRAVRFAAELGYSIAEDSLELINRCAVFIKYADRYAVMSEMTKLLLSPRPDDFRELHKLGLLRYIMPELERCFGQKQKNKYHIYDVGEHIMNAVKNTPKDYVLRWAALLHDIGKPLCASTDSNGTIHFYGHHRESRYIADDILHRYGMKPEYIRDILILIENHDVRVDPSPVHVKKMMAKTGEELFDKLMLLQTADNMAKNPRLFPEKYRRINAARNTAKAIIENGEPYCAAQLGVNAKDLMRIGFRPGKEITETIRILLDEVVHKPALNRRDYLITRAKEIKKKRD